MKQAFSLEQSRLHPRGACAGFGQIEMKSRAEAPLSSSPAYPKAMSTEGLSWGKQSWQQIALLFSTEL